MDGVEITKEQEEKLMEHLRSGITAIPSKEKEKYIQSRFKEEDNNVKKQKLNGLLDAKGREAMTKGWISVHRQIWNSWVWDDKPFSKGQAWIDLLLMANHEDRKVLIGNQLIIVKRGSFITSIRKLCDRWGWSNTKVRSFL